VIFAVHSLPCREESKEEGRRVAFIDARRGTGVEGADR
jgi:hypothetical protein